MDIETVAPAITQATVDATYAQAQRVVSGPLELQVAGQTVTLPVSTLTSAARITPTGGLLPITFDGTALREYILSNTEELLEVPNDAYFEFVDGVPTIMGGEHGTTIDASDLAIAVQEVAVSSGRQMVVEVIEQGPAISRASLEAMGINEIIGSISTPAPGTQARTNNLIRGGEILTGQIIMPGEVFSIIEALGPINAENGFAHANVIVGGQFVPGMGGGLSQLATNAYNAAYFAGFEIIERRPHTVFLPRYPAGREATFHIPSRLDMRVRNTTDHPVMIRSWVSGGDAHMEFWGTPKFRVETSASPRTNIVPAEVRPGPAIDCAARAAGQPGFSITNTRRVFLLSDNSLVEETSFTWRYNPDHGTSCGPQAPVAPPEAEPEG
jgi:vancomycin resistance protein YoaR